MDPSNMNLCPSFKPMYKSTIGTLKNDMFSRTPIPCSNIASNQAVKAEVDGGTETLPQKGLNKLMSPQKGKANRINFSSRGKNSPRVGIQESTKSITVSCVDNQDHSRGRKTFLRKNADEPSVYKRRNKVVVLRPNQV